MAALALPIDPRDVLAGVVAAGPDGAGERLVRTLLSVWDDPQVQPALLALARSVIGDDAGRLVWEGFIPVVVGPVLAVQFMPALVLPQVLLCGLFVVRAAMPDVLEAISNVLPLSYAVDAMQELVGAADTGEVSWAVAVVGAFALAALALGAATLRRRTP